jgi:hypothetical protein
MVTFRARLSGCLSIALLSGCSPPASNDAATDSAAMADSAADRVDPARDGEAMDASASADATVSRDVLTGPDAADAGPTATDASVTDGGAGIPLDSLATEIAASVCASLFRCCTTAEDLTTYFAPYVASTRLESVRSRLPPNVSGAAFTEATCRAALTDAYAITPWADWISAARAGRVTYDGARAQACRTTLREAACGRPAWDALTDPRCFGFTPATGDAQRSFFRRTQTAGAACSYLRDGAGGVFFGTCDPSQAFCCYNNGGRCSVVPGSMLPGAMGTCRAASAVGEACTIAPSLQVCRTGLECDGTNRCAAARTGMLASGASCWSAADGLLGDCPAGEYCSILGTNRCETLRAEGASCGGGDQCVSAFCACPSGRCLGSADGGTTELGRCAQWALCAMR